MAGFNPGASPPPVSTPTRFVLGMNVEIYSGAKTFTDLSILPLRNPARCPRRAGGFHLLLELLQIDFDQLSKLRKHAFEFGRRVCVLIDLCLRRTGRRHARSADNRANAFVNRRRQIEVPLRSEER